MAKAKDLCTTVLLWGYLANTEAREVTSLIVSDKFFRTDLLSHTLYLISFKTYFHKYDKKFNTRQISEPIGTCQGRNKQCTRKVICVSFYICLVHKQNTDFFFSWTYCGRTEMFNLMEGLWIKLEKGLIGKALTFVQKSNTASWHTEMTDEMKLFSDVRVTCAEIKFNVLPIKKFTSMNICHMRFIAKFPISLPVYLTWSSTSNFQLCQSNLQVIYKISRTETAVKTTAFF